MKGLALLQLSGISAAEADRHFLHSQGTDLSGIAFILREPDGTHPLLLITGLPPMH